MRVVDVPVDVSQAQLREQGHSLLGVETDNERGNVDDLLADTDVPLPDEDTGVVNGLGKADIN